MIFRLTSKVDSYVNGLLCMTTTGYSGGRKCTVLVICNPCTGQLLTLPRVKTRRIEVSSFSGYDPIGKRFKLLCMKRPWCGYYGGHRRVGNEEHQVMTLGGDGKPLWRMIECSTEHYPLSYGICVNGVLYYVAEIKGDDGWNDGIVSFDIGSEKFGFIEKAYASRTKLVNYKGKLATLKPDSWPIYGKTRSYELCVLEDAEKSEWKMYTYVLPPLWKDVVGDVRLEIIGVTTTCEIVLFPYIGDRVFFVYHNLEKNTVVRVEIQGLDEVKQVPVHTFVDHVEDVKLGGLFPTL